MSLDVLKKQRKARLFAKRQTWRDQLYDVTYFEKWRQNKDENGKKRSKGQLSLDSFLSIKEWRGILQKEICFLN
jgi:hypothetical protein